MNRATEFPGYPFGWIRDYMASIGVDEPMDDMEAESAMLSDHAAHLTDVQPRTLAFDEWVSMTMIWGDSPP